MAIHSGHQSLLAQIEHQSLQNIFSMREQALPVDNLTIRLKTSQLCPTFCAKGEAAQISVVQHFILRHGYVYHFATHTSQRDPNKTVDEATDFINVHRTLLDEPLQDKRYS